MCQSEGGFNGKYSAGSADVRFWHGVQKLVQNHIKFLGLVHMQPMAGVGDFLVRQIFNKHMEIRRCIILRRDDCELGARIFIEGGHRIKLEDGFDNGQSCFGFHGAFALVQFSLNLRIGSHQQLVPIIPIDLVKIRGHCRHDLLGLVHRHLAGGRCQHEACHLIGMGCGVGYGRRATHAVAHQDEAGEAQAICNCVHISGHRFNGIIAICRGIRFSVAAQINGNGATGFPEMRELA